MGTVLDKKQPRSSRDDAIVTARVPAEIKRQGNAVLKKIGSTPTELVNAAYQYVLEREELPSDRVALKDVAGVQRVLSPEQKQRIRERMRDMRLVAPANPEGKSFKQLLDEAREERYARFA